MLNILPFSAFTSAASNRAMDPLLSMIARDFDIAVAAAALVFAVYALPYSLGQPVLGPIGDHYGKVRVLKTCLWVQTLSLAIVVLAPSFEVVLAGRLIGGIASGGLMPMALAIAADRFPPEQRQAAIARNVTGSISGAIFASGAAGILAVWLDWRAVFLLTSLFSFAVAIIAAIILKETQKPTRHIRLSDAINGYRSILSNPNSWICFVAVMFEGIALFGTYPFIAPLLERRGAGGAAEAGIIITISGFGALTFTILVKKLLTYASRRQLMSVGGMFAMTGPLSMAAGAPVPVIAPAFFASGFGYMMVHNSIHAEVASLSSEARTSAFALHSCFFFVGQAIGPLAFAAGSAVVTSTAMLVVYSAILLAIGPTISRLLSSPATSASH